MTGRTSAKLPATTQSSADVAPAAKQETARPVGTPIRPPIKLVKFNVLRAGVAASSRAVVDLPEQLQPTTTTRRQVRRARNNAVHAC